uniref:Uncharacterized protein n=1 Tax=Theileria annulata TaxID=5874 RepID=A0A3B0MFC5_THEAN
MLKKLKEIKNGNIKSNRILIVGTNPLMCSNLLQQFINLYDYKFFVIPINSNNKTNNTNNSNKEQINGVDIQLDGVDTQLDRGLDKQLDIEVDQLVDKQLDQQLDVLMDKLMDIKIPIECIIAESRCRNIYKEDKYIIKGVDYVIYVFDIKDDLIILDKFFKINKEFGSIKILIVIGQNEEFKTLIQESNIELSQLQITCILFNQSSNFTQNFIKQIFHIIFKNLI